MPSFSFSDVVNLDDIAILCLCHCGGSYFLKNASLAKVIRCLPEAQANIFPRYSLT